MKFCFNCGKEIKEDAGFCPFCGTSQVGEMKGEEEPQPTQRGEMFGQTRQFVSQNTAEIKQVEHTAFQKLKVDDKKKVKIVRREVKEEAQGHLSGNWGEWAKGGFIFIGILVVVAIVSSILQIVFASVQGNLTSGYGLDTSKILLMGVVGIIVGLAYFLLYLAASIFSIPFFTYLSMDTMKEDRIDAMETVKEVLGKEKGRILLANLLVLLFTFLWSLLFFIPGIIKSASYAMTNFLLKKHPEITASEAITLSKKFMHGYKLEFIIFRYSFFLWMLLLSVTGVTLFYVIPYMYTSEVAFFEKIYTARLVEEK